MKFHRNVWYALARSEEIDRTLSLRMLVGLPILMFRKENGDVASISNVCPHRFAPLDRGTLIGDRVQCKYHGLEFDGEGRCANNPHADRLDAKMHIESFPTVERHGFVWIWPGDAAQATKDAIPDLSAFETSDASHAVHSYLDADYRYDILVDNLMDLSHADYLHVGSFSAGSAERTQIRVREQGADVVLERIQYGSKPLPFIAAETDIIDIRTTIHWRPGQVITFRIDTIAPGQSFSDQDGIEFYHIATPSSERRTHYFMGIKIAGPVNPGLDAELKRSQVQVIEHEDGPMLEAIDRYMGGADLIAMRPLILPVDAGGLRVRKVMRRLIEAEATAGDHLNSPLLGTSVTDASNARVN